MKDFFLRVVQYVQWHLEVSKVIGAENVGASSVAAWSKTNCGLISNA
jgi:hypothetical protein